MFVVTLGYTTAQALVATSLVCWGIQGMCAPFCSGIILQRGARFWGSQKESCGNREISFLLFFFSPQMSNLEQNSNGVGQHPPGPSVPVNPHYQLPKPGLWNPIHGDSWGQERKNVAAPERQVRLSSDSIIHPIARCCCMFVGSFSLPAVHTGGSYLGSERSGDAVGICPPSDGGLPWGAELLAFVLMGVLVRMELHMEVCSAWNLVSWNEILC